MQTLTMMNDHMTRPSSLTTIIITDLYILLDKALCVSLTGDGNGIAFPVSTTALE